MARTRGHGRHGRVGGRRHCYGCSAAPIVEFKLLKAPPGLMQCGNCGEDEDRCYCWNDGALDPWLMCPAEEAYYKERS